LLLVVMMMMMMSYMQVRGVCMSEYLRDTVKLLYVRYTLNDVGPLDQVGPHQAYQHHRQPHRLLALRQRRHAGLSMSWQNSSQDAESRRRLDDDRLTRVNHRRKQGGHVVDASSSSNSSSTVQ